jgi:hypothetical protein
LAKLAAAAPFTKIANFANNHRESSLIPPVSHSECATNEDIYAIFDISFVNFANWVMAITPSKKPHMYFEWSQKPIAKS